MADPVPMTTLQAIAAQLTSSQRRALPDLRSPGCRSMRPYHNLHGDIEFADPEDATLAGWDGRDLDVLHRLGLAQAEPAEDTVFVDGGPHEEVGELEATHRWTLTEVGLAVLSICQEKQA